MRPLRCNQWQATERLEWNYSLISALSPTRSSTGFCGSHSFSAWCENSPTGLKPKSGKAEWTFRRALQQWWADGWDLLLTPTLAEPPPPLTEFENNPEHPMAPMRRAGRFAAFTPPFNMSGQPAISLPLHRNAEGLPIGIQLAAAYGREDILIRIASQLESAHPWTSDHPAVP